MHLHRRRRYRHAADVHIAIVGRRSRAEAPIDAPLDAPHARHDDRLLWPSARSSTTCTIAISHLEHKGHDRDSIDPSIMCTQVDILAACQSPCRSLVQLDKCRRLRDRSRASRTWTVMMRAALVKRRQCVCARVPRMPAEVHVIVTAPRRDRVRAGEPGVAWCRERQLQTCTPVVIAPAPSRSRLVPRTIGRGARWPRRY